MTSYFLSGLGADRRIFSNLALPGKLKIVHVDWIPNQPNESLANYTSRLSKQIDSTEPFQLVGVSFGGIVATELSKLLNAKQIIIISSIATHKQLPVYFNLLRRMLHNPFFPTSFLKSANPMSYWLFGTEAEQTRLFFKEILEKSDASFIKWAIEKIAVWDNTIRAENLYHIHGTGDKIFPITLVEPDYVVPNGGHLMVYDKHEEISKVLAERLMRQ